MIVKVINKKNKRMCFPDYKFCFLVCNFGVYDLVSMTKFHVESPTAHYFSR